MGGEIFYWHLYPLRLSKHFPGFFSQFETYSGFNFYYLGDVFLCLISLWFALQIGYLLTQGLLKIRFSSLLELLVINVGIGLWVLGMVVFGLGILGILRSWVINVIYLIVAPGLALINAGTSLKTEFLRHLKGNPHNPRNLNQWLLKLIVYAIIATGLITGFLYTLTPPTQSDGLRYHLAAPQEYIKYHRIVYLPFNAFTNFPFLIEMLFTLGMMLWSDTLAKLFHFSLLILSGLMLVICWRHIFQTELITNKSSRLKIPAELLILVIFFSTPVALIVGSWEFIDLGVVFFFLGLIYAVVRWLKTGELGWLITAGIFAGASLGTKYTMIVIVLFSTGWIFLYEILRSNRLFPSQNHISIFSPTLKHMLIFLVVAGFVGSPWYIKNLVNTGNPVYPFAYEVFDGGEWSKDNAEFYRNKAAEKGLPRSFKSLITAPWDTAIYWADFEAFNPGNIYLLFFPLFFVFSVSAIKKWHSGEFTGIKTIIFFAASYFLQCFFSYQSNRFLLPFYSLCVLLIVAVTLRCWHYLKPLSWLCVVIIILSSLYGTLWSVRWMLTETNPPPLPVVLGFQTRDAYLQQALNYYDCARWLNHQSKTGKSDIKVLLIGEHRGYYFSRVHYLGSDWFDTPWIIHLIRQTKTNEEVIDWLKKNGVNYILFNLAELNLYYERYFKPRFTETEINRFEEFINSSHFVRVFPPPGTGKAGIFVCEIK